MGNPAPKYTGKSTHQPPADEVAEERARDLRVLAHIRAGLGFDEAARREGYADRSGAWRAFHRVLKRNDVEGVEQYRAVQGEQLEAALAVWLPKMLDGDKDAAVVALRIWERQARLFGLDAPARMIANVVEEIPDDPDERRGMILSLVERIEASASAADRG